MREEEAHQEDRGQSDSSEEQDGDIIVEGAQESGPTGVEAMGPSIPTASIQEAEPTMEVDMGDIPPLTSKDATAVTPEEDDMLTGDPTSVAREMAWLQVVPFESHEPENGEIIEHHPLVMRQSLSQSEAFPPLSLGWPQPIRDFPAIEPSTLQHHNTKSYKKRCT